MDAAPAPCLQERGSEREPWIGKVERAGVGWHGAKGPHRRTSCTQACGEDTRQHNTGAAPHQRKLVDLGEIPATHSRPQLERRGLWRSLRSMTSRYASSGNIRRDTRSAYRMSISPR